MVFLDPKKAKEFSSPVGFPDAPVYTPIVQEDGQIELKEVGKHSVYNEIQSYKDSCDINVLIERFKNGDIDALNQRSDGAYGDFATLPKTHAEILQIMIDARNSFDRLPVATKQKFNNDFNYWFATYGNKEWLEDMGFDVAAKPIESAVNDNSGSDVVDNNNEVKE